MHQPGSSRDDSESPAIPSAREVRRELAHILASPGLQANDKRRAFLSYIVEETLAGRSGNLKGYTIAVSVFGRDETFDAQSDSVVRTEARRLRRDLDSYYMNAGNLDVVRISIPKGAYVPHFERLETKSTTPAFAAAADPQPEGAKADLSGVNGDPAGRPRWNGPSLALAVATVAVFGFAVVAWMLNSKTADSGTGGAVDEPAVVVLPFTPLGSTANSEYLAAGIGQELIVDLMKFPGFRLYVSAPGSSNGTLTKKADAHRVPDVAYIVNGSVREDTETALVTVQMIYAATDEVLWSESFVRPLNPASLIQLQIDLAKSIAAEIGQPYGFIPADLHNRIDTQDVSNLQSYVCVLRAYDYRRGFPEEQFKPVLGCLEEAVKNDPQYSDAWAMLGWLHLDAGRFEFYGPDRLQEEYDMALEAASRAVELEPDNPLALKALSSIHHYLGNFEESERLARLAVSLNPNDPDTLAQLGWRLAVRGRFEEGIPLLELAVDRSVNPPGWYFHLMAIHLYLTGEFDEMLTVARRSAVDGSELSQALIGIASSKLGDLESARAAFAGVPETGLLSRDPAAFFHRHGATDAIADAMVTGLTQARLLANGTTNRNNPSATH